MRRVSYSALVLLVASTAFGSCSQPPANDSQSTDASVGSRSEELRLQSTSLPDLSGLREHLDASSLQGLADGALVTSWTPRVGAPATQVADQGTLLVAPSYVASSPSMNGRPAVRFGKTTRSALAFSLAEGANAVPTSQALTVVVVGSRSKDAEPVTLWHNDHLSMAEA